MGTKQNARPKKEDKPKIVFRRESLGKNKGAYESFASVKTEDGLIIVEKGDLIVVWRERCGESPAWHRCKVMEVDEDKRVIHTYDETDTQCWSFEVDHKDAPVAKVLQCGK